LCLFSIVAIAIMGLVAVYYNLCAPAKTDALRVRQGSQGSIGA